MLKKDLVKRIGDCVREHGFKGTINETSAYLDAFKEAVLDAMSEGEEVYIGGFLRFWVEEIPEHKARNPRTGETVTVPTRGRVKVRILSDLKDSARGEK